ncbi:MAG: TetR family transcriptional regulator [Stutzerimonas stutzeri]|nr:MAG: TetR family transcriptional regulator [Stutzerimonas stutzeri]
MSGLRDRKKADRNRRILEAAGELFREIGFEGARLEDIAARADVGVGTAYNYFSTKGEILLAITALEVENVMRMAEIELRKPISDVTTALERLVAAYFDHSLVYLTKAMWRSAIALSIQQPTTTFGQRYDALDLRLSKQVLMVLQSLQRSGLIAERVDIQPMSEIIFNNINSMFTAFVKHDDLDIDAAKKILTRQHAPIVDFLSAPRL